MQDTHNLKGDSIEPTRLIWYNYMYSSTNHLQQYGCNNVALN